MEENKKWSGSKNKKKFKYNPNNNRPSNNNDSSTSKQAPVNTSKKQTSNNNYSNTNNNHNSNNQYNRSNNNNSTNNKNNYRTGNNKNTNYKSYNNRYNNNKNKPEKSIEEYEKEYLEKKKSLNKENPICPICNEPIYILETAIKHSAYGTLSHFDCILKELNDSNELDKNEKIVYLGSGTFGIIQERSTNKNDRMKFFVRKRIVYEDKKEKEVNIDIDAEEEEIFDV